MTEDSENTGEGQNKYENIWHVLHSGGSVHTLLGGGDLISHIGRTPS